MDSQNFLPKYDGPVDHMRFGVRSLEKEMIAPHPVVTAQKQNERYGNLEMVRHVHGSAFAMRLATERENHSRMRRLPGLLSSNIFLDTLNGEDTSISFEDFLHDPITRPEIPKIQVHEQIEIKFGIF